MLELRKIIMNFDNIKENLKNEPEFRLKQVYKAIFFDMKENWTDITSLPQSLREKLSKCCPIDKIFQDEKIFVSDNKETIKALFVLEDDFKIESVLMKHKDRNTVCVSSQSGCAMDCKFCATGQQKFKRNLSVSEILGQILFFTRLLKKSDERVSNIVFMGMGEPFLNYDNVLEAIRLLNDKDKFNVGARHISISTCGIIEGIERLSAEPLQINLAISLHAPNDKLRSELMPINKKYPLVKIIKAVNDYIIKTKRRVMFEYLLIDDVNDSFEQAKELASLVGQIKNLLFFVNLISFNPIGHSEFNPSSGDKIKKFKGVLEKSGIAVTQRYRFGKNIKAACGQLAGQSSEALAKEDGQL